MNPSIKDRAAFGRDGASDSMRATSSSHSDGHSVGDVIQDASDVFVRRGAADNAPTPVRRIPISTRSITGQLGGQGFESALERDLLMQLAWDEEVLWFVTQPVHINYEFPLKRPRQYTPDVLIEFDSTSAGDRSPMLCEVKYRAEIAKNWRELRRKFRAAKAHCANVGWRFFVLTEDHIRTPRLKNIQFLWSYRNASFNTALTKPLQDALRSLGPATMLQVIDAVCSTLSGVEKEQVIWAWWVLVANKEVDFDMNEPIRIETLFYLPRSQHESD